MGEKTEEYVALAPMEEGREVLAEKHPLSRRPDTYWWPALGAIIFCCMPCGIIALIAAYQAEDSHDEGNSDRTLKYAKRAKHCIMWSVAVKVTAIILYSLFMVVYIISFVLVTKSYGKMEGQDTTASQ